MVTRRLRLLNVVTNLSGSRLMPTQQPFTKIFVAFGISAGEISYMDENKQIYTQHTENETN